MRVLWLSHRAELGGAELGLVEGIDALARRGHDSHVVLPAEGPLEARLAPAASVRICPSNPWTSGTRPSPRDALRWLSYNTLIARSRIAEIIQQLDVDVVISNTVTVAVGGQAARKARRPHLWWLREFGLEEHGVRFVLGERLTFRIMRRLGDAYCVESEALRDHYEQRLPAERIRLIHSAIAIPAGLPLLPRTSGPFRMILIGAQRAAKGQAEALDALSALRVRGLDVVLDLVGDGNPDFEAELVNRARRHGISDRVRWLPFQPDPFPLLDAADVVLTCSRGEGLGRGTIEGMKMAKPVIGAESGATPELIRHNWNGLLYPPGDVASLARCVEQLYRDRESAREMGRRGRDFALAAFNLSSMGVTLEAVLHDCIVAPRAPSMRPP